MARRGQHETSLPENESWDFDGNLDPLGEVIWKYNKNLLGNHENRMLGRDAAGEDGIKRRCAGDRSGRMKTTAMSDSLQALLPQVLPPTVENPANSTKTSDNIPVEELRAQGMVRGRSTIATTEFDSRKLSMPAANPRKRSVSDHLYPREASSPGLELVHSSTMSVSRRGNNHKLVTLFQTWTPSMVCLIITGDTARVGVRSLDRPDLLPTVRYVLEKRKIELVSVTAYSAGDWKNCFLTIRSNGPRPDQMLDGITIEHIYKQAAEEIASRVMIFSFI